ncbi:TRAP transporter large permease [Prauserella halophila]|uniref:TRAP transporter large permease n=1 Tax=Prauserella halophila TaxID=185641 RepID=A0ABP4H4V5_9PSEU|nr:TRAP transporter large permease [Prauserella halophila]
MPESTGAAGVDETSAAAAAHDGEGAHPAGTATFGAVWLTRVLVGLTALACLVVVFGPFTRESVGAAAIVLMLLLIAVRVPIGIALAAPGVLGLFGLHGPRAMETVLSRLPYETVASWEFSVIPMFVFMGLLLWKSGVTERLYSSARALVGRLPGGLAIGTTGAGAGLAAVSGSTVGSIQALARIGVPEMLRSGYDKRLAVGSVIMAGLPGQIIPPSVFLVIYAGLAQVPVGPQLMAGIVPGAALALCFALTIVVLCTAKRDLVARSGTGGDAAPASAAEKGRALLAMWPLPVLVAMVLGGMYTGLVTVTEAGAAGALAALLLAFGYAGSGRRLATIAAAATETLKSLGTVFFLFVGAMALSQLLAVSGIGPGFADWVVSAELGRVEFLLVVIVAYLVLGTFMDPLSILLLTVPLLMPVLAGLGISPLWFGVFVVILAETAIVTPPVGVLAFIVHGIVKDPAVNLGHRITIGDIFRGIGWFLPAIVVLCLVLIAAPGIATMLPEQMIATE